LQTKSVFQKLLNNCKLLSLVEPIAARLVDVVVTLLDVYSGGTHPDFIQTTSSQLRVFDGFPHFLQTDALKLVASASFQIV
jgi:hypothetical protein